MTHQSKCPRSWEPIGFCKCEVCAERRGNKGQCPVFGCTIPRGIPHEHPAGVSAVMRDPGAPLTDIERAELQYHRRQAADRNDKAFQAMIEASSVPESIEWSKEILDKYLNPMVPGRKLRDSLMMAGNIPRTESTSFNVPGGGSVTVDTTPRSSYADWNEAPRLSVVKIVGYFATGIVIGLGVVLIVVLSAMNAGVL